MKPDAKNVLDALSSGTSDGLRLAVNVAAMLSSLWLDGYGQRAA